MTTSNRLARLAAASLILALAACGGGSGSSSGGGGGGGGGSSGFYEPFTSANGSDTGLWLVSSANPSAAPTQVTAAAIELPDSGSGPTFYDWTYDSSTRKRNHMLPRFFVYGSGKHLFGISLTQPGSPQQLSSGSYAELCSAVAVQSGPYSSAKSYVVAQVSLSSSSGPCDTTWIIPTNADAGTAPATPASQVHFLAGLKDTNTGLVTGFLMYTSSEVDIYSPADMTKASTVLSSLPAGTTVSLPNFYSPMTGTQPVILETDLGLGGFVDSVYLMNSNKAILVAHYGTTSPAACGGTQPRVQGAVVDSSFVYYVGSSSTGGAGYDVFSVPLSGGTPSKVYSNTTGCPEGVDAVVPGRLVLDEFDLTDSSIKTLSVAASGPAGQTPAVLQSSDEVSIFSFVEYYIGSNGWVVTFTLDPSSGATTGIATSVVDVNNGHTLKTYDHAIIAGDLWKGFNADGSLDRGPVFVAEGSVGTTSSCFEVSAKNLELVNPSTFASNTLAVSGSPCTKNPVFGPAPLGIGPLGNNFYYVSNPSGNTASLGKVKLTASGILTEAFGSPGY